MKNIILVFIALCAVGCTTLTADYKQQLADKADAEARRTGNSGPLYDLYVDCVNDYWRSALDQGGQSNIYEAGLAGCAYELNLLCNFYAKASCYQDAKLANRLLFSLMLEDYHQAHSSR